MKKIIVCMLASMVLLQFCTSSKKNSATHVSFTYAANVQPTIIANCSPCHIPPKGFKKAYNTYDAVRTDIDEMLRRINLNPGDKGFMPFKHAKLSDSLIHIFTQWKTDGLKEN